METGTGWTVAFSRKGRVREGGEDGRVTLGVHVIMLSPHDTHV